MRPWGLSFDWNIVSASHGCARGVPKALEIVVCAAHGCARERIGDAVDIAHGRSPVGDLVMQLILTTGERPWGT